MANNKLSDEQIKSINTRLKNRVVMEPSHWELRKLFVDTITAIQQLRSQLAAVTAERDELRERIEVLALQAKKDADRINAIADKIETHPHPTGGQR